MSGEGVIADIGDLSGWGYAPGNYPVNCIDCSPDQDKTLGSISSMRCPLHAINERRKYADEGFTIPEPQALNLDVSWPVGRKMLLILMGAFGTWAIILGGVAALA